MNEVGAVKKGPEVTGQRTYEFDRSLLRAINEASLDGILVVDEQGVVVSYNQRFIEVWQISPTYLQANLKPDGSISENRLMHAALAQLKDPETFLRRVQELYATPMIHEHCELELIDGRVLERYSVGLHNDDGMYLGRVWFFRDISQRKHDETALRRLAWRDPLTGEMNRGHFLERAAEEQERAHRYQHPLGLLMLDLDFFKEINDQYGHAGGDCVLETVCKRWRTVLRKVDLLGRLGGEEFAVLLPDSDQHASWTVAERLRCAVADNPIQFGDQQIKCTVSGGMVMVGFNDSCIKESLRRADIALYRAKRKGRNRMETDYKITTRLRHSRSK